MWFCLYPEQSCPMDHVWKYSRLAAANANCRVIYSSSSKSFSILNLSSQVVCEPAAKTKLQLLNCTQLTVQFLVEKEAINSEETFALVLLLFDVLTACPKSQILTLLSRAPEASSVPSALKARLYTVSVCPRSSLTMLPADKSHKTTRRSSPADTRYWPSGEIAKS